MPLANNLKIMKFKIGQKVIEAGEILMNFYIIGKGRCKVNYTLYFFNSQKGSSRNSR